MRKIVRIRGLEEEHCDCHKTVRSRIKAILKFAFIDMPKEIGPMTLLGIFLAAIVATFTPKETKKSITTKARNKRKHEITINLFRAFVPFVSSW
jgi:uncharacterized membrane protein YraQ (UPF0718 family)